MSDDEAAKSLENEAPSAHPAARRSVLSKKKLEQYNVTIQRKGIIYMSKIPPHLKPLKLRQLLEPYGKVDRIYMAPVEQRSTSKGKSAERGKVFGEAWIEFDDKKLARAVAEMLNGKQMGGKHRSKYHDDLWTLKYLPKFKWHHLTEGIAYQKAVKEKKLVQELSAAKKERDFYLCKVSQAKKLTAISERKRKQGAADAQPSAKRIRSFHQREPKAGIAEAPSSVLPMLSR